MTVPPQDVFFTPCTWNFARTFCPMVDLQEICGGLLEEHARRLRKAPCRLVDSWEAPRVHLLPIRHKSQGLRRANLICCAVRESVERADSSCRHRRPRQIPASVRAPAWQVLSTFPV